MTMTIAFLDHHLDNWHAKVFLGLLRERGHDVVAFETNPAEGDWCAANDVRRAEDPDEAIEAADAVMVLAPDDIEAHLDLCLAAIPAGKPVWIDKQVAPSAGETLRVLRAAEYHSTPVTSGSSLRHAAELEDALEPLNSLGERGGGEGISEGFFSGYGSWGRYGVHTVAMALRAMGGGVSRLVNVGTEAMPTVALEWPDDRRATLVVAEGKDSSAAFPWRFALRTEGRYVHGAVTRFDEFYRRQLDATLADFETRASHPWNEMLDTVRILEAAPSATEWTSFTDL